MWAKLLRLIGIVCMAVTLGTAEAQRPKDGKKKDDYDPNIEKVQELSFWDKDEGVGIQYSLMCVSAMTPPGHALPAGVLTARVLASSDQNPLAAWKFVFEKALPLDERYLAAIKDGRPLPDLQMKLVSELKGSDLGIYLALNQALHRADQANQEMFERSAADNKRVISASLNKQPGEHRGKVVSVTGKLVAIREIDAPRLVRDEMSVVYYAYIQGPTKGAAPYAVVFTELPLDLKVGEVQNASVTMHGYFLGLIRFQADRDKRDAQPDVISPYLVGKTLVVTGAAADKKPAEESTSYALIVTVVSSFIALAVVGAVAIVWLRRGDRQTQSKLAEVRDKHTPFNLEPSENMDAAPAVDVKFKNEE